MESKLVIICGNKECKAIHTLTGEDFNSGASVKTDEEAVERNKQAKEDYKKDMEHFEVKEKEVKKHYERFHKGITFTRTERTGLLKRKKTKTLEKYTLSDYGRELYIYDRETGDKHQHIYRPHRKAEGNELYIICSFCGQKNYLPFNRIEA